MAQVATADSLKLPPDSTGKGTGMFKVNIAGTDVYLPASVLTDASGNANDATHPVHARLTDGTSNYDGAKTGQLPSALVSGRLDVNIGASGLTSLAINNVETIADNAGFTDGTSKVFPSGFVLDESAGTALTENDVGAARMDSKRALVNVLEDGATRGRKATVSATGGLLGDQGAPAAQANAWFVRPRQLATYGAGYRLVVATGGSTTLLFTPVVNTDKQLATIYHAVSATKTVRLRRVSVLLSIANANVYEFEVRRLSATTAPASGNPAITPAAYDSSSAAAEATCLALPTTAGSETAADRPLTPGFSVNTAAGTAPANVLGVAGQELVLYDARQLGEDQLLTLRAGVAEGFAVIGRGNTVNATALKVFIEFTEE